MIIIILDVRVVVIQSNTIFFIKTNSGHAHYIGVKRRKRKKTRKSVHRTRMLPPKCHSEKGYICNCDTHSMKLLLRLISFFIEHDQTFEKPLL